MAGDIFRVFNEILTSIMRDWNNCGAIAFNIRTMTDKASLSHRYSMLIIGVYSLAVAVYVSVIMEINHLESDEHSKGELILKMKFPFGYDFSPIYEIVMFVQFLQLLSNASVIGMLDALIVTLVSFSLTLANILSTFILTSFNRAQFLSFHLPLSSLPQL